MIIMSTIIQKTYVIENIYDYFCM